MVIFHCYVSSPEGNVFSLGLILLWPHCLNPQYVFSGVSRHWSGHGQRTYIPPTNIDPENHKISQVFILGDGICKSTPKPIWYHVMILQYITIYYNILQYITIYYEYTVCSCCGFAQHTGDVTFDVSLGVPRSTPLAPAVLLGARNVLWSCRPCRKGRSGSCIKTGWWFGTVYIFPYIGKNNPIWLIFFRGVGIPPTRKHMETGHRLMVSDVWWQ